MPSRRTRRGSSSPGPLGDIKADPQPRHVVLEVGLASPASGMELTSQIAVSSLGQAVVREGAVESRRRS